MIKLTVNDQYGNYGYSEYIAKVSNSTGCANLHLSIANSDYQYEVPYNKGVNFSISANNLANCSGNNDVAGKVEWYVNGLLYDESLGCNCIDRAIGGVISTNPTNNNKCIQFTKTGIQEVKAKVYPYTIKYFGSIYDEIYPVILYDEVSEIVKTINVVDYEQEIIIKDLTSWYYAMVSNNFDENLESGTILIDYDDDDDPFTIKSGDEIQFSAYNMITIKPGFVAEAGCNFAAVAMEKQNDNSTSCEISNSNDCDVAHMNLPEKYITVSVDKSWQDPCTGRYDLTYKVHDDYGSPYIATVKVMQDGDDDDITYQTYSNVIENSPLNFTYSAQCNKTEVYFEFYILGTIYKTGHYDIGGLFKSTEISDTIIYPEPLNSIDFSIYPNPAENNFTLKFTGDHQQTDNITVYNNIGQKILTLDKVLQEEITIDISNWPNGMYIVRLISINEEIINKLLVKE